MSLFSEWQKRNGEARKRLGIRGHYPYLLTWNFKTFFTKAMTPEEALGNFLSVPIITKIKNGWGFEL